MAMTSDERLSLIRPKIDRAKQHVRDFECAREQFFGTEPVSFASKIDPQTGYELFSITRLNTPPAELGLIAGDAIHNLRAALDHLVWQLVLVNGNVPSRQTAFPIYNDAKGFDSGYQKQVNGLSQAAIDVIYATKPYQEENWVLWLLHRLDIADKHHALLTTIVGISEVSFEVTGYPFDRNFSVGDFSIPGMARPLVEGQVFLTRQPERHKDITFTFDIAITEEGVVKRKPLLGILTCLCDTVESLIVSFKPLLS